MLLFLSLCVWASRSLATDSPAVEGWQFDGNTRSTWDIVWSCFSTILACTWTVIHGNVPAQNKSDFQIGFAKFRAWFLALMAPELVAYAAAEDLLQARRTAALCNKTQEATDGEAKELTPCPDQGAKSSALVHGHENLALNSPHTQWTLAQGFCLNMGGVVLQTDDEWIYTVETKDVVEFLIKDGIMPCSNFKDRDIKDRAKADSLAKALTVLQSTWALINIVARAVYRLPISPIELSTVAYVVCGILTYAFWWHKPKDMTTPITLNLRYTRENLPQALRTLTDSNPKNWVHLQEVTPEKSFLQSVRERSKHNFNEDISRGPPANSLKKDTEREEGAVDIFGILAAVIYCGIHVAAWNYIFPTQAERIAWRVFALVALSMACVVYIAGQLPPLIRWFIKTFPLFFSKKRMKDLEHLADPTASITQVEFWPSVTALLVYFIARFGIFALMLSSLRALPVDSYTSIDWLASVPHI